MLRYCALLAATLVVLALVAAPTGAHGQGCLGRAVSDRVCRAFGATCSVNAPIACVQLTGDVGCYPVATPPAFCPGGCYDLRTCMAPACAGTCDRKVCERQAEQGLAPCWGATPFVASKGIYEGRCGTEQDMLNNLGVQECCLFQGSGSCLTTAATCDVDCDPTFCAEAAAAGLQPCPHGAEPGEFAYVVSHSRTMKGWCGMNSTCSDLEVCLLGNPNVQSCCRFSASRNGCAQATCAGVQCPPWACHITPGQERCPTNMFECIAGTSQFGCSTSPTHWTNPENQCTSCCDVSTCAITCSATCPPDVQASLCAGRCSAANPFVCSAGTISGIVGACSRSPVSWEYSPFCTSCCQCAV